VSAQDWRPTATRAALLARAELLARTRAFFAARAVLEVQTPALVGAATSDPQIQSFDVRGPDGEPRGYLHSSPEYAMKRLLAAGSGDIFQLCPVYRAGERSRLHNPEFTLLEWYRLGFGLTELMQETAQLAQLLLDEGAGRPIQLIRYSEAFQRYLGLEPLEASLAELAQSAREHGLAASSLATSTRDDLLDFLVATQIGPQLGRGSLCCLHHYPASQAALAQLDATDARTALRFELYAEGVELANGYVELADAREQQRRFAADRLERQRRGLAPHGGDARLVAALEAGLPPCAGVALGFDRLLMLRMNAESIDEVLALPAERA
jgi:lysyl-tRNA synthetase class 2